MVKASYDTLIDSEYEFVKLNACGRQACSVMIIVADEIDAISTARMLTQFLKEDNIAYTIRCVSNMAQVQSCFEAGRSVDIKSVFLINCGATSNIPRLLNLEHGGDTRCFIIDNHRPIHLANIYSRHSVVVFENEDLLAEVPEDGPELTVSEASSSSGSDLSDMGEDDDDDDDDDDDSDDISDDQLGDDAVEEEFERENDDAADEGSDDASANSIEEDEQPEGYPENDREELDDSNGDANENELSNADSNTAEGHGSESRKRKRNKSKVADGNDKDDRELEDQQDEEQLGTEDNDEDEEEVEVIGKRRRALADKHDPARRRRRQLQQYYSQANYFVAPSAFMLMTAMDGRSGSQVPLDLIWNSILGVTDQYLKGNIPEFFYLECCNQLRTRLANHMDAIQSDAAKNTVKVGEQDVAVPTAETGHITEELEFRLFLYRHWSLYEAIFYSPYIAAKLSVWKTAGENRLQEMLAKMGISLQQCKQSYSFISPVLRSQFRKELENEKLKKDYNLTDPDILYQSFCRFNSFKSPIAASDVVYAASALLEHKTHPTSLDVDSTDGQSSSFAFNEAYDCLGMKSDALLRNGVAAAISLQKAIMRKVSAMLEGHDSVTRLKRLYFAFISKSSSGGSNPAGKASEASDQVDESPFSKPNALLRLGKVLMDLKRSQSKRDNGWFGKKLLPLVLLSERSNSYLVVGISPIAFSTIDTTELDERDLSLLKIWSNFKHFFPLAGKFTMDGFRVEGFDGNVIEISKRDALDFVGALDLALTQAGQSQ